MVWRIAVVYDCHATVGLRHMQCVHYAPLRFAKVERATAEHQAVGGVVDVSKLVAHRVVARLQ